MKSKLGYAALIYTALITSGCSSLETRMDSWLGVHVDELVSSNGPPDSTYPLSSGGHVLQYSRSRQMVMPGITYTTPQTTYHNGTASAYGTGGYASGSYSGTSTTYVQKSSPATVLDLSCTTRFTVSKDGYITAWSTRGSC